MQLHRNAKLDLRGRRELVRAIERGMSPATAHRWWHRWRAADAAQRASLVCLLDRSSRPRRCPRMLSADEQARICAARRRSGWGPRLIAGETGHPHATVWRTLHRAGVSRPPRAPREQARRYEWPCPGDLLHIDSKRFGRFTRPGHAVTGIRDRTGAEKRLRVGWEFVHSIVDDDSLSSLLIPPRVALTSQANASAAAIGGFVDPPFDCASIRRHRCGASGPRRCVPTGSTLIRSARRSRWRSAHEAGPAACRRVLCSSRYGPAERGADGIVRNAFGTDP